MISRRRLPWGRLSAALAAISMLLLAACGGGAQPDTGGATPAPAGDGGGGRDEGAQVAYADELRIGWQEGQTLDISMMSLINDFTVAKQIYSGLVQYKIGTTEIVPDLATEWSHSEDGLTWTFNLRQGVQWHNGYGEFVAQDVVDHFNWIRDPDTSSIFRAALENVESVEAPDDHTVVFRLKEADAFFLDQVVAFRQGFLTNARARADFGEDYFRNPVGTGPYVFKEWVPGQYILLEANPDYYAGEPKTRYLRFVHIPDESARRIALENGEIDVFWNATDPVMTRAFEEHPDFEVASRLSTGFAGPLFNFKVNPLDDVRVRQAIAYAIDYDAITEGVRGGLAEKGISVIPPGMFGHTDDVKQYEYNPDKARELLAEAGLAGGFTTSVNVLNSGYAPDVFAVIQSNLRDIGIDLQINLVDPPTWSNTFHTGDAPMVILLTTRMNPDQILTQFFYGPNCAPAGDNFSCWDSADDLIARARVELDEQKRAEMYKEIQQLFMEELPGLPLMTNRQMDYVSKRVHNYVKGLAFEFDALNVIVEKAN